MRLRHASTRDKLFLALFAVFALMRGWAYLGGRELHDLLGMAGFVLLAIGVWKRMPGDDGALSQQQSSVAMAATLGGGLMVLGALALQWLG